MPRPMSVRKFRLGDEPLKVDLGMPTTVAERLELVWTLTRECWAIGPHPWPTYARADAPVVKRRLARSAPAAADEP